MQQAILDLIVVQPPSFDNFVSGSNADVLARVQQWATDNISLHGCHISQNSRHDNFANCVYIWGEVGSGCSHLLQAAAQSQKLRYIDIHRDNIVNIVDELAETQISALIVDHLDAADEMEHGHEAQPISLQSAALFRLLRWVEKKSIQLLLAGHCAPRDLPLPPEIKSRVGKMMILQLHRLSDDEKCLAMQWHANRRGLTLTESVLHYFIHTVDRDMRLLNALVESFDVWCLQNKYAPTLPMARRMIKELYPCAVGAVAPNP